jgi:hypothetical protein
MSVSGSAVLHPVQVSGSAILRSNSSVRNSCILRSGASVWISCSALQSKCPDQLFCAPIQVPGSLLIVHSGSSARIVHSALQFKSPDRPFTLSKLPTYRFRFPSARLADPPIALLCRSVFIPRLLWLLCFMYLAFEPSFQHSFWNCSFAVCSITHITVGCLPLRKLPISVLQDC